MLDIVRDAPFGQLARFLTGNKVFLYHEEEKDFQCRHCYIGPRQQILPDVLPLMV